MASISPHLGKGDLLALQQQGEDHGAVHRQKDHAPESRYAKGWRVSQIVDDWQ